MALAGVLIFAWLPGKKMNFFTWLFEVE
jgi:hypothetical protein